MRQLAFTVLAISLASPAVAQDASLDIDHVLLLSVDGLHARDVARYVEAHPRSALASASRPAGAHPGVAGLGTVT
jgi:hypothetical protein